MTHSANATRRRETVIATTLRVLCLFAQALKDLPKINSSLRDERGVWRRTLRTRDDSEFVANAGSPQLLIINVDVLESQRDICIQIEAGTLACLQLHSERRDDYRLREEGGNGDASFG